MSNRKSIGSGEFVPSSETARKNKPIEIPESWLSNETPTEVLQNHETITEEPRHEVLLDDAKPSEGDVLDNTAKEKAHIAEMLAKYPIEQQKVFDNGEGIELIYLGEGELSPELAASGIKAKSILNQKFGGKLGQVFRGLKVYYVRGEIKNAGFAYSGANAIILDIDKNSMTIDAAEQLLGPHMLKILDEGDWSKIAPGETISGETTLVHEFGHLLQAKVTTKFSDTENSPTKYGRSKEWEDYAESFLYYCYNKPTTNNRSTAIEQDISSVIASLPVTE